MLSEKLLHNAIALLHINKKGGEMLNDLNKVLKADNVTVDSLLHMDAVDFVKTNANEVMGTEQVGFGKEFVEERILAKELMERLENDGSLLSDIQLKTMSGKTVDFPVQGAKFRMVRVSENTDAPDGSTDAKQIRKAGTAQITITAVEMAVTVFYSDTWLEDSVISVAEYVLNAITEAYETSLHEIVINGDTTIGTGNINISDGNTSALPDGNDTDLTSSDGARKLAIDNGAVVDAGTNLAVENIRSARAKMGVKGLDPSKLRLVPDTQTYFDLMNLTQVETMEKFGDSATIKNGVLVAIDGIKIVNREEMLQALADGTNSVTPADNVLGSMLIVHMPSVKVGIRRNLTTELERFSTKRTTGVTGSSRAGVTLDNTQNNKQPTSPSALIVNI